MKKILTLVLLVIFNSQVKAAENWEIERVLNNEFISVSTHGTVTHGDKYRLLISTKGKCDIVEDTFTFYTMSNHPEILDIGKKKLDLRLLEIKY